MMPHLRKPQCFKLLPSCYNTFTQPSSQTAAIPAAWDWDSSYIITTQAALDSLRVALWQALMTTACLQKLSHLRKPNLMLCQTTPLLCTSLLTPKRYDSLSLDASNCVALTELAKPSLL